MSEKERNGERERGNASLAQRVGSARQTRRKQSKMQMGERIDLYICNVI